MKQTKMKTLFIPEDKLPADAVHIDDVISVYVNTSSDGILSLDTGTVSQRVTGPLRDRALYLEGLPKGQRWEIVDDGQATCLVIVKEQE